MHPLMTVHAAWNIWNFRRSLVAGLLYDGHSISVLAPPDDSVPDLELLGCRFLPLAMRAMQIQGLDRAYCTPNFNPSFLRSFFDFGLAKSPTRVVFDVTRKAEWCQVSL